jgi:hypothetical protein
VKIALSILVSVVLCSGLAHGQKQLTATGDRTSIFETYPNLKTQVTEHGDAFVRKDFERLVELTWPKYVAGYGKAALLNTVAKTARELEENGVTLVSWTPGEATQLIEESGFLYAVVPTVLKLKASDQTADTPVCLIAISADRGEDWTFISSTCVKPKREFPQVAKKLILCEEKESVGLLPAPRKASSLN